MKSNARAIHFPDSFPHPRPEGKGVLAMSLSPPPLAARWLGRLVVVALTILLSPTLSPAQESLPRSLLTGPAIARLDAMAGPDLARKLRRIEALQSANDSAQARALAETVLARTRDTLGVDHPATAIVFRGVALFLAQDNQIQRAVKLLLQALQGLDKSGQEAYPLRPLILHALSQIHWQQRDHDTATAFLEQALKATRRHHGRDHPDIANALLDLGTLYGDSGRFEQAAQAFDEAEAMRIRLHGAQHPEIAQILRARALLAQRRGRFDRAKTLLLRSLTILARSYGKTHPSLAKVMIDLSRLYTLMGEMRRAELLAQRALSLLQTTLGDYSPEVAAAFDNLAAIMRDQGRRDAAQILEQRAVAIYDYLRRRKETHVPDAFAEELEPDSPAEPHAGPATPPPAPAAKP